MSSDKRMHVPYFLHVLNEQYRSAKSQCLTRFANKFQPLQKLFGKKWTLQLCMSISVYRIRMWDKAHFHFLSLILQNQFRV